MHRTAELVYGRKLCILILHRVLPDPDPMLGGEMDAGWFERLLAHLAANYNVVPLSEGVRLLRNRELPSRTLAITFDDGYRDNAEIAAPMIARHGLCATFFVSTGFLDGGRMWNDSVIETLRASKKVSIDLGDWGLGRRNLGTVAERRAAASEFLAQVKHLGLVERSGAVDELHRRAGRPGLPHDLMMTRTQVRALADSGMEVGAHTVMHPILASMSDEGALSELADGRDQLQALVQREVRLLAYPNGRPQLDYREQHVRQARSLGFEAAVSTAPGAAGEAADLLQLPRFMPWDRSELRWSARLASILGRRFQTVPEVA